MTMSKEMQLLKSKLEYSKIIINALDNLNFIANSNNYDKRIEEIQNELSKIYKRLQEIKEEENNELSEIYKRLQELKEEENK